MHRSISRTLRDRLSKVELFLVCSIDNENIIFDMIKEFGMNIMNSKTSEVRILCKHDTTSPDGLASFRKHGILKLNDVLTRDTPIRKFLLENGIEMILDQKTLRYKDYRFYLFEYGEDCAFCCFCDCQRKRNKSNDGVDITYKDFNCGYRDNIKSLTASLYHDKCEIEFHIHGGDSIIVEYSCVGSAPDLFMTLDNAFVIFLMLSLGLLRNGVNLRV